MEIRKDLLNSNFDQCLKILEDGINEYELSKAYKYSSYKIDAKFVYILFKKLDEKYKKIISQ